jgi:hypothetical protein
MIAKGKKSEDGIELTTRTLAAMYKLGVRSNIWFKHRKLLIQV